MRWRKTTAMYLLVRCGRWVICFAGPGREEVPGGGVGAVTDREPQAVPGNQVQCGGLVVHRWGDDGGIHVGEAVQ
jgi:hypothetical protein